MHQAPAQDPEPGPSAEGARPHGDARDRPWPLLRYAALLGLLLLEAWFFKERFRTDELAGKPYFWAPLLRSTRHNVPWSAAVLTSLALLAWPRLRLELAARRPAFSAAPLLWKPAALHAVLLAAFYFVTATVLGEPADVAELSVTWPAAWLLTGVGAALAAAGTVLPLRELGALANGFRWTLVQALVAGTALFALGSYVIETWPFWEPLALGTLHIAAFLIGLFLDDIVYEPSQLLLGTEEFPVIVTKFCSGYEGISLFVVFFTGFLILCKDRLRFPRALLLLPLGTALVWLLNAVRIAGLIMVGVFLDKETAIDGFHEYAGWTVISVVALGMVALGTRMPFFAARPVERADVSGRDSGAALVNPTAVYLGPMLAVVATTMLLGAFTSVPESQYPYRVIAGLVVLWVYRREYVILRPTFAWSPIVLGSLAFGLWLFLLPEPEADPLAWQAGLSSAWLSVWWAFRIFGGVVIAPIVEELVFRGYLTRRLLHADFESVPPGTFAWPSFLISSALFGALHSSWLAGVLVGMLYALAYYRRGRLFDAVAAHAVTNGLLVVYACATGTWGVL